MILRIALGAAAVAFVAAGAILYTPARPFNAAEAVKAAQFYDARIIRDRFGVPHVYGERDADVAFGLAYAHAEDDWTTLEEVLFFSRGELARRTGKDGAITDFLVAALNVRADIDVQYDDAISDETKAVLEGYAAGLNLWCAEKRSRCARGVAPVSAKDIVAGFTSRTPFFYGLDEKLTELFKPAPKTHAALQEARMALLDIAPGFETGSNAMAVAPSRSADGHTRLMVNSHQPYTGPVAWYEARVKSEQGWDMIGGIFPGAPMILHGAGPSLGWAFTVNKPDLVDVYALEVDDPKKPVRYRFDGGWRAFESRTVTLRVKLFGPFTLPVKRRALRTVHGPAFETPNGVVAVSYGGMGEIRAPEQWFRMNKARDFDEWRAAMTLQAIPSFNVVYADHEGRIAYYYNAAIPVRDAAQDWNVAADGSRPDLLWRGVMPFGSAPKVVEPASGFVVNANHTPFESSGDADNPRSEDFPPHMGIDRRSTNRGIRIQQLYGGDPAITAEEFVAYKMDDVYAVESRLRRMIAGLLEDPQASADTGLAEALAVLAAWNGSTAREDRSAALAIRTGHLALGYLLNGQNAEAADAVAALRTAAAELRQGFGRIDPEWAEALRLVRGASSLPLDGGPDTLRAVYPSGTPADGAQEAAGGDTYILYADWAAPGAAPVIRTIHQFGSATLDPASPHFADQAPLFADEDWKSPPMEIEALLGEATRDYRPGRAR